jgi:nucleotide-binding universal stress UspA family protein
MTADLSFRDILFATDFSEASRDAGRTAAELARHFGARLHVLHVVPPVTDPTPESASLAAAVTELGAGLKVVTAIASGRVSSGIVHYAARHGVGLIVLGTHGRTGMTRALLGSVAEAVTRRARCRVMTVPAGLAAVPSAPPEVEDAEETSSCAVCAAPVHDELICGACRARIRGEALGRKRGEERGGRR